MARGHLIVFALFSNYIFDLYGITIPFQIAGASAFLHPSHLLTKGSLIQTKMTDEESPGGLGEGKGGGRWAWSLGRIRFSLFGR